MHRKKFTINGYLVFALATVILLSFMIAFFARLPRYSETYTGRLSEEAYSSVERAALAYLSEEIESDSVKSELISCKSVKTLTDKQIAGLELEEEFEDVEQVEVTYRIGNETYHGRIYACHLEKNGYKYFTPPLYVGENITKSYYDSVVSSSDMLNCTLNLKATSSLNLFGVPIKGSVEYQMLIADGYSYYDEHSSFLGSTSHLEIYSFDGDNRVLGVAKQWGTLKNPLTGETEDFFDDWQPCEVILPFGQPKSISEFSLFGLYEGMDHTFFEKTQTGFAAKRSRQKEFSEIVKRNLVARAQTIQTGIDEADEIIEEIFAKVDMEYDCNYVVENGHLRQAYLKQRVSFGEIDWKEITGEDPPDWFLSLMNAFSAESSFTCDIIDVGTTSFSVPPDAQREIDFLRADEFYR